jgi:hypothetical protein
MTALKPLEALFARGVPSRRYPLNKICAHPDCKKDVESAHHIFPKSQIGNGSWFVALKNERYDVQEHGSKIAIPHVIGLCGNGTMGHHGDLEEHRAWIRYEDGEYVWYDRNSSRSVLPDSRASEWDRVGPLNPQPASGLYKQVRGRGGKKNLKGEERRKRRTISFAVPADDQEDGAGVYDDLLDQLRDRYDVEEDYPAYHLTIRAFYEALTNG